MTAEVATPAPEAPVPAADPNAELREWLTDLLPKSAHKKIDEIVRYIEGALSEPIYVAEVYGARAGIDPVEVYGLEITLDANGNAASVAFPYGAFAAEQGATA